MSASFLYFAYGSNMLSWRLRDPRRCASARAVGVARLDDHVLRFHKRSLDGSGKCDAVAADPSERARHPGGEGTIAVWGVLYEVSAVELARLDAVEGTGYARRQELVRLATGGTEAAYLYAARREAIDPALRPFTWYRDLVVAGAEEHALDERYARRLGRQPAQSDPDAEREARERRAIERWRQTLAVRAVS